MTGQEFKQRCEALSLTNEQLAILFICDLTWIQELIGMERIPMSGLYDLALDSLESEYATKKRQPDLDMKLLEVDAVCASVKKLMDSFDNSHGAA